MKTALQIIEYLDELFKLRPMNIVKAAINSQIIDAMVLGLPVQHSKVMDNGAEGIIDDQEH